MTDLIRDITEQSNAARADRFYSAGTVVGTDPLTNTALADVGAPLPDGTSTYKRVAYSPQQPPQAGDAVTILHTNVSPHSGVICSMQKGNSQVSIPNNAQVVQNGGVSMLNGLTNAVILAAGTNVTLNTVGNTITINSTGGGTPSPLTTKGDIWGYSTTDTRIALSGSNGFVLTEDTTQATGVKWAAAPVTSVNGSTGAVSFSIVNSLNSLTGALSVAAGNGIGVSAAGSSVTVSNTAGQEVNTDASGTVGTAAYGARLSLVLTGSTTAYTLDGSVGVSVWEIFNATSAEVTLSVAAGTVWSAPSGSTVSLPPNENAIIVSVNNSGTYDLYLINQGLGIVSVSSNTVLTVVQCYNTAVHCNASGGNIAITLPSAVNLYGDKFAFAIRKTDSSANTVTITAPGGQTIDGAASKVITAQWGTAILYSDGTNIFTLEPAAPLVAGSNITITQGATGQTIAASADRLLYGNTSVPGGNTLTGAGLGANTFGSFSSSYAVAGNTLVAGQVIRVWVAGVYSSDATTPGTITIQLLAGSTVIFSEAGSLTASQTNKGWFMTGYITVDTIGSGGTLEAQGFDDQRNTFALDVNTATIALNTTLSQTLAVQMKFSSALSTNTFTLRQMVIELLS